MILDHRGYPCKFPRDDYNFGIMQNLVISKSARDNWISCLFEISIFDNCIIDIHMHLLKIYIGRHDECRYINFLYVGSIEMRVLINLEDDPS